MTALNVMSGDLGDIFWDLAPWIVYTPGYDLGCSIYVANPSDEDKEYSLMARLTSGETLISEEVLPVFGTSWFTVASGEFVKLHGALRFEETDVDLTVLLIERESEEATDAVTTRLVGPSVATLPPAWPGGTATEGFDWSSLLYMTMPFLMLGFVTGLSDRPAPVEVEKEPPRKLLTEGRRT